MHLILSRRTAAAYELLYGIFRFLAAWMPNLNADNVRANRTTTQVAVTQRQRIEFEDDGTFICDVVSNMLLVKLKKR